MLEHNVSITNTPWIQGVFNATLVVKTKIMETRSIIILQHFLKTLESRCETEKLQDPIAPAFIHLLHREELIEILALLYGNKDQIKEAHPNYENESNEVLLFKHIRDEYYILHYFCEVIFKQYTL